MNKRATPRFAVVIPAYNEAGTIRDVASRACSFAACVIIVDDGSTDGTAQMLSDLPVTLLSNAANAGKAESLRRGARHALNLGMDCVITLDGDGQHCPEDIPRLLEAAAANPKAIVIAARVRSRHAAPLLRRFANRFADFWISWAAGRRIRDTQSGFRLYPEVVFRTLGSTTSGFTFESELLIDAAHAGIGTVSVPIDTIYHQQARASHYRPATDTLAIVRMVAWKLLCRGLYPLGLARSLGILKST